MPYITTVPKIIGGSLGEHREQTRRRVFDALTSLLADKTFESIPMAELAASAGIGRTAIYNHFPNKESIVVAFATDETSRYLERLDQALDRVERPSDRLRAYVQQHLEMVDEFHFGLGPELYGMLSPAAAMEIRDHVVAVEQVLRDILEAGCADGSFVIKDLATTIVLVHSCLQPRSIDAVVVADFVVRAVSAR